MTDFAPPRHRRAATAFLIAIAATPILLAVAIGAVADADSTVAPTTASVDEVRSPIWDGRTRPLASTGAVPFTSTPDVAVEAASAPVETATTTTTAPPPEPGSVHVCPVLASEFIDSWGFARSGGRRHKGVDMMAAYGEPVLAPTDGVVRSSNSRLGGLGFYLDGFDGNTYFGSHLATLDHTGLVQAGMQIGTVGTSGNAFSPHLHFEVHPGGGSAVNPYPFVDEWCTIPDWAPDTVSIDERVLPR